MHVLQVVPYYAPAWAFGGPPKVMWEEARELVRRGHEVTVFTTDCFDRGRRTDSPSPSVEEGVVVHRFRNLSNYLAFHHYRFTPIELVRALRRARPDVIHLSEIRHELAIGAWWLARKHGVPLAVSAHGTLPVRQGPKAVARRVYDRRWVRPMLSRSAALLAQTEHERALYGAFGARESITHLLPLGIDAPPAASQHPPSSSPDRPFILFLGRISPLKGVERLIRGFAGVAAGHPELDLVVAGRDDGALDDAMNLARNLGLGARVHFPGPVYGDARFDLYRQARAFAITPTHFEETSLASLEAASVGTPVVISREADLPFLDEYNAGFRVAPGDDPTEALELVLESDRAVIGAGAARMAAERHFWPGVVDQLERILEGSM